jgi:phosphatidylglycerophosphate synthase
MIKVDRVNDTISGRKRKLTSFFQPLEQTMIRWAVPRVPKWFETYHLTLMTIPLSLLVIFFGYLARTNHIWIIGVSLCVILQYITDALDGAVGRYRDTGLVKWGFFMDHMTDFVFAHSVLASYILAYSFSKEFYIVASLMVSGFFVMEFLKLILLQEFSISGYNGIGPSELRVMIIISNLLLPVIPEQIVVLLMNIVMVLGAMTLLYLVAITQKRLWKADMRERRLR